VALGSTKYIGEAYMAAFREDYEFSILEAYDREETKKLLPQDIAENGPIDALIVRLQTPPYEPLDQDLLGATLQDHMFCKGRLRRVRRRMDGTRGHDFLQHR
jgi:hypothetical protein